VIARLSRSVKLGTIGAVVALLVGVATLLDFFERNVREPAAAAIDSRIESARLEPTRQDHGDYLREQEQSLSGYTRAELREEGLIFLVSVRLRGNLGDTFVLRYRLYRDEGRPVRGAPYDQLIGSYTAKNQEHARRSPFWLPYPPRAGRFYARFTLLDSERKPIDDLSTRVFTLDRIPAQ
jgi:hypothetical protein